MLTNIDTNHYGSDRLVVRQRFGRKGELTLSRTLLQALAIFLGVVTIVLGGWSLYVHWQVSSLSRQAEQLYSQIRLHEEKNINLRALRAGLISQPRVVERARQRLHLVLPDKDQVHSF